MSIVALLFAVTLAPLAVIDLVFLTEVLLGLVPGRDRTVGKTPTKIALLIPAHNEAGIVRASIAAMARAVPPGARLALVAHNCSDATATEAQAGGAEVFALDRPEQRGKGYALAHGRDCLAADPPEIVIVIDADCVPADGAIARLAAAALASGRAVQATYLFRTRPGDPPTVQISNFALLVKNLVRQRGGRRIGAPALLTGSGMAFPWALFARLDLATGNIVEDLALGVDLVRQGAPPLFEERATIWSTPSSASGTATQRTRWEGGFLATARSLALPLVAGGIAKARWSALWMGLHLLTPPLTLLLLANALALALFGVVAVIGGPAGPLIVSTGLSLAIGIAVLAAWAVAGREMLAARTLVRLPLYLLWKLALYARLVRRRQGGEWTRTERTD